MPSESKHDCLGTGKSLRRTTNASSAASEIRACMCACCAMPRDSCSRCSGHAVAAAPASSAARALLTYSESARPHSRSTASASRARPPSAISSASLIPRLNWPAQQVAVANKEASWLRNATRSRVRVTPSERGNPTTPIRSIEGRPAMNRDAAAIAGRPSSRLMCAWSTATTTIRPSPAPWFELKWLAETGSGGLIARPGRTNCAETMRRGRPSTSIRKSSARMSGPAGRRGPARPHRRSRARHPSEKSVAVRRCWSRPGGRRRRTTASNCLTWEKSGPFYAVPRCD